MGRDIFVSHATADTVFVEEFVETILKGCGLREADLFVSSMVGLDVRPGEELMDSVRRAAQEARLVIAVITPTYPTRPVCVAELGAAWGVVGKLVPLLAPGLDRRSLDGVLPSINTVYIDDDETLDRLRDMISDATGLTPESSPGWSRAKRRWRRDVHDLAAGLDVPQVVTTAQFAELRAQADQLEADLEAAEADIVALERQNEALHAAKTADEADQAMLPSDDIERFEVLREQVRSTMGELSSAVRQLVRHHVTGSDLPRYDRYEDPTFASGFDDAVREGLIDDDGTLDLDFEETSDAVDALRALDHALAEDGDMEPEFFDWFRTKFGVPPSLRAGRVWDALFPRL